MPQTQAAEPWEGGRRRPWFAQSPPALSRMPYSLSIDLRVGLNFKTTCNWVAHRIGHHVCRGNASPWMPRILHALSQGMEQVPSREERIT